MPLWQDKLFIFLMKNAANPTDFFNIPPAGWSSWAPR